MSKTVNLKIKHAGKVHDVSVDTTQSAVAFKEQVYQATGKIVVKGGMLKDDADLSRLGLKEGAQLMVIGPAGELLKAPTKPMVWLEDMTDKELAAAVKTPGGLENLGNTCYMNATIQVLRAIPELQTALNQFQPTPSLQSSAGPTAVGLTSSLKSLYQEMGHTTTEFSPLTFWTVLRSHVPQFQEMRGGFPAQQDAEECWSSILTALRATLAGSSAASGDSNMQRWVDQYMAGELTVETKSVEAPEEPAKIEKEPFMALKCNISGETNFLVNGIKDVWRSVQVPPMLIIQGFTQELEKTSESLGRQAVYTATTKVSRLPSYLTVHEVRFFWRREINKKAKIMRRIKFPFELDVADLLTDDLKSRVQPVNSRFKAIDRDRRERAKIRKRTKQAADDARKEARKGANAAAASTSVMEVDDTSAEEPSIRKKERLELEGLLDSEIVKDTGANATGMYDLIGIVTHKGASADGGHYIGWVKSSALDGKLSESSSSGDEQEDEDPEKEKWIKFDDDKVSIVPRSKITLLDGGGEDSIAYILLYRSMPLA